MLSSDELFNAPIGFGFKCNDSRMKIDSSLGIAPKILQICKDNNLAILSKSYKHY